MKKILLILGIFLLFVSICYAGDVSVRGYYRKDGTYVAPYHRSSPNSTVTDNYSYKGNVNPYTGEVGDNYYRNNPTSAYYGTSPNTQSYGYSYSTPRYYPQQNQSRSYQYPFQSSSQDEDYIPSYSHSNRSQYNYGDDYNDRISDDISDESDDSSDFDE